MFFSKLSVSNKKYAQLSNDFEVQSTLTCFEKLDIEKADDPHQVLQIQHHQLKNLLTTEKERNVILEKCLHQQTGTTRKRQWQLLIAQAQSKKVATSLRKSEESYAVLKQKNVEITACNDARG